MPPVWHPARTGRGRERRVEGILSPSVSTTQQCRRRNRDSRVAGFGDGSDRAQAFPGTLLESDRTLSQRRANWYAAFQLANLPLSTGAKACFGVGRLSEVTKNERNKRTVGVRRRRRSRHPRNAHASINSRHTRRACCNPARATSSEASPSHRRSAEFDSTRQSWSAQVPSNPHSCGLRTRLAQKPRTVLRMAVTSLGPP